MDPTRFDGLTRRLGSRRTTLGGLLGVAAALAGLDTDARKKKRHGAHAAAKKKHTRGDAGTKKKHDAVTADKKKKKKKKCKGGTIKCGKACVNAQTDALNCGRCGNVCGNGVACVGGRCAGSCPASQIRCVDLCVDPSSNEQHCGGCGIACTGDLTCLNGACGCAAAGETMCGDQCVDTRSDRRNCGACGVICATGETCSGSHCNNVAGYPCETVYDCGGAFRGTACRNGQCACENPAKGLCRDPSLGSSADCDTCCPGGSRICRRDEVCRNPGASDGYCACPQGSVRCDFGDPGTCSAGIATDPKRCGRSCTDCTLQNTGARCCFGTCLIGGFPGGVPSSGENAICGSDCTACPSGTICCNNGPATTPECVAPRPETSVCPNGGG